MHVNPASPQALSFEDARHLVEEHAAKLRPRATEEVELLEGVNRVLAEPIHADRDFPPFPRAARDGYAIRAAELAQVPAQFDVTAEIRAGADREGIPALAPGQTVAIMTGAAAPLPADSATGERRVSVVTRSRLEDGGTEPKLTPNGEDHSDVSKARTCGHRESASGDSVARDQEQGEADGYDADAGLDLRRDHLVARHAQEESNGAARGGDDLAEQQDD